MSLITIGLLTHNRSHLVSRAINSVLSQSFTDFELIISDDNSSDDTEKVVAPFLTDKRVSYVKHEGIGMTRNFIETMRIAGGKYFMWLCDDDYISNDYIEKTLKVLEDNKDYVLACGLTVFFSNGRLWDKKDVLQLEDDDPAKRLFTYFKHVDNNVILYGLMRREEVNSFVYPDTFGADILWSAQVAFAGKVKIIEDSIFYYSKEGISQNTEQLAGYYNKAGKKAGNPYVILRDNAFNLIKNRQGAFQALSLLKSRWMAFRVWMILRDRFCISSMEFKIRSKLRIGSRLKALVN